MSAPAVTAAPAHPYPTRPAQRPICRTPTRHPQTPPRQSQLQQLRLRPTPRPRQPNWTNKKESRTHAHGRPDNPYNSTAPLSTLAPLVDLAAIARSCSPSRLWTRSPTELTRRRRQARTTHSTIRTSPDATSNESTTPPVAETPDQPTTADPLQDTATPPTPPTPTVAESPTGTRVATATSICPTLTPRTQPRLARPLVALTSPVGKPSERTICVVVDKRHLAGVVAPPSAAPSFRVPLTRGCRRYRCWWRRPA